MLKHDTDSDLLQFLASKVLDSRIDFNDALGLTRIVEFISLLKKPIITHNGMLDLMFLYNSFFEPLPPSLAEFRLKTNALFPHIYDTKHLINTRMQLKTFFA